MVLETDRLRLRTIYMEDAKDIYEYSKEANVGPNAGWKPHENIEETIDIMKMIFLEKEGVFAIEWKENQKVIGSIGLIEDPKRENDNVRMLGYALSENYWGKGIMTEAVSKIIRYGFEQLQLDVISAYCYPENKRSKNVIKKCGFQYEGSLRKCEKLYDSRVLDNECYSILKEN